MDFFLNHWVELVGGLLIFAKLVVNLTPSINDNRIFSYIDAVFDAIVKNRTKTEE